MAEEMYFLTKRDLAKVKQALRWIKNFRGYGVTNKPDGASIAPPPNQQVRGGGGGGDSVRMQVVSISNDYLTCRMWDGTNPGTVNIVVAKPYELRHVLGNYTGLTTLTTTDTQTVEASDGTDTETWKVTPAYKVDGEIWASQPVGGTGLGTAETPVSWMDDNRSGRAWAVEPE